jgi:hypothetical protein
VAGIHCVTWCPLLEQLPGKGIRRVALRKVPESGVHVDVASRRIGVWGCYDNGGLVQVLDELRRGWDAESWEDRCEEQVTRCQGALRVPELAELLAPVHPGLEVNSDAVIDSRERPTPEEWARLEDARAQVCRVYTRSA